MKASASTEYTIYLVPCKHTAEETQKGYDEYLTIKNSAGVYVWEILGNTRDLDLSDYVSKTATGTQTIKSSLRIGANGNQGTTILEDQVQVQTGNSATQYGNGTIKHGSNAQNILTLPNTTGTLAVIGDITNALKGYVALEKDETINGHKTFGAGFTTEALTTFGGSATFNEDLTLACPLIVNKSAGAKGQVLTSQGAGKAPQWATIPQGTVKKYVGDITVAAGGTTGPTVNVKHNLDVTGCTVSLYQANELVMADIKIVDTNNIQIIFGQPFTAAQTFQVVVTG